MEANGASVVQIIANAAVAVSIKASKTVIVWIESYADILMC